MPKALKCSAGDALVTTEDVVDRIAFYASQSVPGTTTVTIAKGSRCTAATDSFGGNVGVHWRADDNRKVVVFLAQGEWALAT